MLKSRTCNGVPECKDLSDERNCPTCPIGALACTVWGKKTCLPEDDLCKYQPESCEGKDVSFCAERTLDQKWESCCKKLATNTNVDIQRLCATNTEDLDSLTSQDDSYLFSSYLEFQHLSYNISICQDQVKAFVFSCHYLGFAGQCQADLLQKRMSRRTDKSQPATRTKPKPPR